MASSPQKNLQFISPPKEAGDFLQNQVKENPKYCYKYDRSTQTLFTYSEAAIELIVSEIKKDPEHIIQNLKNNIAKK